MIFLPLQTGLLLLIISHTSALHRKLNDCQDIQKLLFHQKDSTNCLPAEATKCSEATLREKMKNRLKEFLKGEYQLIRLSLEAESTRPSICKIFSKTYPWAITLTRKGDALLHLKRDFRLFSFQTLSVGVKDLDIDAGPNCHLAKEECGGQVASKVANELIGIIASISNVTNVHLCLESENKAARFPRLAYRCIDVRCRRYDDDNTYADALTRIMVVFKYVLVGVIPWMLPLVMTVTAKKRFATIGPHLWQHLDAKMWENLRSAALHHNQETIIKVKEPSVITDNHALGCLTLSVEAQALESEADPASIGIFNSLYRTLVLCRCGSTSGRRFTKSRCRKFLTVLRCLIFMVLMVPLPFYLHVLQRHVCSSYDADSTYEEDAFLQQVLSIRHPFIIILYVVYVPCSLAIILLVVVGDPKRSSSSNPSMLWSRAVRETRETSWVHAFEDFGKHLVGIFRKRKIPRGKSTIMSSLQLGHRCISPLRRSRAWPLLALLVFPIWLLLSSLSLLITLFCYIPIVFFAFQVLVFIPFRISKAFNRGSKIVTCCKWSIFTVLWLGNVISFVFVCIMVMEVSEAAVHLVVYVVMGVVVNANTVLPHASLLILLLFYTHLCNLNIQRGYRQVKQLVFRICREDLVPKYMRHLQKNVEMETEDVETTLEKLSRKLHKDRAEVELHLDDIVTSSDNKELCRKEVQIPKRISYCHPLGNHNTFQVKSEVKESVIICKSNFVWFVDQYGMEYLSQRFLTKCLQNPHLGPGTICQAGVESVKRLSVIYLFIIMVFIFLKMFGLISTISVSTNQTLATIGTGMLPLLFHMLFVNMKFSMLRRSHELTADTRNQLTQHILQILGHVARPLPDHVHSCAGEDEGQRSKPRAETVLDMGRKEEAEEEEPFTENWTVSRYHLLDIPKQIKSNKQ